MSENNVLVAAKTLKITEEEAQKNSKAIPEIEATYFWNTSRGGGAVIIDLKGEKLAAGSSVNFDTHLQAFRDGRRN